MRCRRESKECYFSATRRKRKGDGGDDAAAATTADGYATRNHRRKISNIQDTLDESPARVWHSQTSAASKSPSPGSPTGVYGWEDQDRSYQPSSYVRETEQDPAVTPGEQEVTNETAAALFQSPINNPGDALHLLLEASGRTGDLHRQASFKGEESKIVRSRTSAHGGAQRPNFIQPSDHHEYLSKIDPAIANSTASENEPASVLNLYRKALKTWSSLRFVRAGWFTAIEAMAYIE